MISEPDDVTKCEGREAVFICVLSRNSITRSEDMQWYRLIQDTGTTEMINSSEENITISTHTGNTVNSSLTITNVRHSHTAYYWAGLPSYDVCNVSLTITTSMHVLMELYNNYKIIVYAYIAGEL